ncbi:MAG: flagellar filament capping protein FliD [Firmicutes bacterium]|nr:flagellar filament capping protein FliD [Bacillota bacterium]
MVSTSFSPINRVAGLVSGLETQKIVEDLMKAARIPLDKLLQQKQILQWRQEDYRAINRALMDFRTNTASPLRLQGTFQAKKATSSDETAVTAVPGGSAVTGTYEVTVTSLAKTGSLFSTVSLYASYPNFDPDAKMSDTTKSFGLSAATSFDIITYKADGTPDATITINVDPNETLNQLLAKIGTQTSGRLTAFFEKSTGKVVISTTKTGNYNENKFTLQDTNWFLLDYLKFSAYFSRSPIDNTEILSGTDAELTINGLTGIKQHENTFTLNNITFTLKKTTVSPVLVTVANDTDKIFETVKSFVDQFNSLLDTINKELTEERYPDYLPLTDAQKEQLTDKQIEQWEQKARSGLLKNDPLLSDIVYRLRRALTTPVTGLTVYDSLFDIGIRTGYYWEGGKLYIDEARLREAINANPEAVMKLFTTSAPNFEQQGLGVRLYNEVNNAISRVTAQAGSPYTLVDNSFLSRSIRELDERIETMEERLARLEDRYWRQFTALEQALATMQAQSNWLAGMAAQIGSAK